MNPCHVLMVSKACLVGSYQRKLEEIAAFPEIDLTVIVPPRWGDLVLERAHIEGYRLLVEPIRFNGQFHLHYYPTLARRIGELKPDIVHIDEEPYNFATYHALGAARRAGAKSLFFSWQNLDRRYPPPFNWMEHWVMRQSDYAIVGTEEAGEVWQRKGYTGPMAVIPQFGVDPDIFSPAKREKGSPFTIGYAGRLVPEKGLDLLIRAVVNLPGRWHLSLVGDGPEREALSTLAGVLNIGGAVSFEKPIPSIQMPDYYRRIDALVLPSRTLHNWKEQFGRVLIEAMACGVPVVGAESGAIPEVIGDAGLTFPEGNVQALHQQLRRLIEDETLRRALSEAGRQRVLRHFTQAQVAARTVEVYRKMMENQ
jgi:glycosyltransferase involved in cell wall biosynthesis